MVTVNPIDNIQYSLDQYLKDLLDGLKDAVLNHRTSAAMITDGRSGMGKTTLSNQVLKYLDPDYNLDNIYFDPNSFLKGLANAKKGEALLFDEAMLISSRSTLSEVNKMIIQAMSMIRSKQLFVCFAVNSIFDLDRNLALSRADLLLHVYGDHLYDRGHFCAFFKPKGPLPNKITQLYLLGKKMYSYARPKSNFHGSFYKPFIVDEAAYETKKQMAINKFLHGTADKIHKRDLILKNLVLYLTQKYKLTPVKISEISGCSHQTIYNILNS
jgi:hypothetical protein